MVLLPLRCAIYIIIYTVFYLHHSSSHSGDVKGLTLFFLFSCQLVFIIKLNIVPFISLLFNTRMAKTEIKKNYR